jgi:hypothetical protein
MASFGNTFHPGTPRAHQQTALDKLLFGVQIITIGSANVKKLHFAGTD